MMSLGVEKKPAKCPHCKKELPEIIVHGQVATFRSEFGKYAYENSCVWCGKNLRKRRTLCCFYDYATIVPLDLQVQHLAGGRFCSWKCVKEWIERRAVREGGK